MGKKIIRYLSIPKYLSMLTGSALYFPSLKQLQDIDPREGHYLSPYRQWQSSKELSDKLPLRSDVVDNLEELVYFSSWNLYEQRESYALWYIYSLKEGVAILSDTDKIITELENFKKSNDSVDLFNYKEINYQPPDFNLIAKEYDIFYFKHQAFDYEKEYRVLIQLKPGFSTEWDQQLKITLNTTIEKIIFSPYNKEWITDALTHIAKKFLAEDKIYTSELLME